MYNEIIQEIETTKTKLSNYIASQTAVRSATGNDSYAITLTTPDTAYVDGREYAFISDVVNTGNATLNINSW